MPSRANRVEWITLLFAALSMAGGAFVYVTQLKDLNTIDLKTKTIRIEQIARETEYSLEEAIQINGSISQTRMENEKFQLVEATVKVTNIREEPVKLHSIEYRFYRRNVSKITNPDESLATISISPPDWQKDLIVSDSSNDPTAKVEWTPNLFSDGNLKANQEREYPFVAIVEDGNRSEQFTIQATITFSPGNDSEAKKTKYRWQSWFFTGPIQKAIELNKTVTREYSVQVPHTRTEEKPKYILQ